MAARKSSRPRASAVQVDLDLDFGGPAPSLLSGAAAKNDASSNRCETPRREATDLAAGSGAGARGADDAATADDFAGVNAGASVAGAAGAGMRQASGESRRKAEVAILTVTQLTRSIRRLLERDFGHVWVSGELSNVRRQANGHSYFTIKDAGAQLSCVLFRGNTDPGMPVPEDGLQVQLGGEISVYEPRGQYQLIVHEMQAAGVGVLQAKFEALKRRLAAEGLFDASRKRPLPPFPTCVALVTSPAGAALRDMLNIFCRRAPWVRLLIFPVRVQGEGAAGDIAAALRALGDAPRLNVPTPDVIVVARGGGSIEDLWCFNEEIVARALAQSPIPTVSAVGHEIDFTIADFAADFRALTPSAAAELVVPDARELLRRLHACRRALTAHAQDGLRHARTITEFHRRGPLIREPRRLLAQHAQQVDALVDQLTAAAVDRMRRQRERLAEWAHRLAAQRPAQVIAQRHQHIVHLRHRLHAAGCRHLGSASERFNRGRDLLRSLGPQAVLARGYTMTLTASGQALTRSTQVRPGDRLTTRLADGSVESVVATPRSVAASKSIRNTAR